MDWNFYDRVGVEVELGDILRARCPHCRRWSNCKMESFFTSQHTGKYWKKRVDLFLTCQGCGGHFYCVHKADYSMDEDKPGGRQPFIETYPKFPKRQMAPSLSEFWLTDDPIEETIYNLFEEIFRALTDKNFRLAAMGLRAVIEALMISKIGDTGTLSGNLNKLLEDGHIARNQAKILEDIIEIGNATIHRQYAPVEREVNIAIDIVESIVSSVMIFPKKASDIASRVPPRLVERKGK